MVIILPQDVEMEKPRADTLWKPSESARRIGRDILFFYTKASPLSNHHPAQFRVEDITYNCMEQYLMYQKAIYFHDIFTGEKIMRASRPTVQKALGRTVKNFDAVMWKEAVPSKLVKGLKAKFSQVPHCKKYLKLTAGMTLAEASGTDNFYGIGFSLFAHEGVLSDQSKWGYNLLGKCLMNVREHLDDAKVWLECNSELKMCI